MLHESRVSRQLKRRAYLLQLQGKGPHQGEGSAGPPHAWVVCPLPPHLDVNFRLERFGQLRRDPNEGVGHRKNQRADYRVYRLSRTLSDLDGPTNFIYYQDPLARFAVVFRVPRLRLPVRFNRHHLGLLLQSTLSWRVEPFTQR